MGSKSTAITFFDFFISIPQKSKFSKSVTYLFSTSWGILYKTDRCCKSKSSNVEVELGCDIAKLSNNFQWNKQ